MDLFGAGAALHLQPLQVTFPAHTEQGKTWPELR